MSALANKLSIGASNNEHDLTSVYEYQNYRRKHVDRIINVQPSGEVKESRSLVKGARRSVDSSQLS